MILLTLFQSRSTSDLTGFSALREVPVAPSDERGRRGRSSETCHNDKPGFEEGVTDESDRRW